MSSDQRCQGDSDHVHSGAHVSIDDKMSTRSATSAALTLPNPDALLRLVKLELTEAFWALLAGIKFVNNENCEKATKISLEPFKIPWQAASDIPKSSISKYDQWCLVGPLGHVVIKGID